MKFILRFSAYIAVEADLRGYIRRFTQKIGSFIIKIKYMGQNSAAKARTKHALKNTKMGKKLRKNTKRLKYCCCCK